MNKYLTELIGREVMLWSVTGQGEHRDDGVFEGCDGAFVKLRKNEVTLYFPIYVVRLIRPKAE
jgi:hypothetical protein